MPSVAINVAANTNEPGFRGPIYPDGSFEYVPIPEAKPTAEPVRTYGDLDLRTDVESVAERQVHFDPLFPEAGGECYCYGDEHGVKARPLAELAAGDHLFFYATLTTTDEPVERARTGDVGEVDASHPDWVAPAWGAYLIGHFELARDPVTGEEYHELPDEERALFDANAHVKREAFDARVLVLGDPEGSRLYDTAVPLSSPESGADPNRVVTDLSSDSGKGPWWRRPLRFDDGATRELLGTTDPAALVG